jgi:hypothetical protein
MLGDILVTRPRPPGDRCPLVLTRVLTITPQDTAIYLPVAGDMVAGDAAAGDTVGDITAGDITTVATSGCPANGLS